MSQGVRVASGSPPTAAADAAISHNPVPRRKCGIHPSRVPPRTPLPRVSGSLYLGLIDGRICRAEAIARTTEWISLRPRVHYLICRGPETARAGAHQTGAPIGIKSGQAAQQRERIFVGVNPTRLRMRQAEIEFRERTASPAQRQMRAAFGPVIA